MHQQGAAIIITFNFECLQAWFEEEGRDGVVIDWSCGEGRGGREPDKRDRPA